MLSTVRPMRKKTRDDKKEKAAIFKFYDFTKGGTDIVDHMNDFYTTRAKTHRWTMLAFYYMLDTIRINAKTLWCLKHKKNPQKVNTFDVSFELANALVMPFICQRNRAGLQKQVLKKIRYVLGEEAKLPKPAVQKNHQRHGSRKRCRICLSKCTTKAEKNNMKRPTQQCKVCGECICDEHSICICDNCNQK